MQHRVIQGREYKVVQVEAADTREASQHVMAQPPISAREQQAVREAAR